MARSLLTLSQWSQYLMSKILQFLIDVALYLEPKNTVDEP